jgi:hypothetical protein
MSRDQEDIEFSEEHVLKATAFITRMPLNEKKKEAELEVLGRKAEELQAQNRFLKEKNEDQQNEMHMKDEALSQYARKLSHTEYLQYEFIAYKEKGGEIEQDIRNIILKNDI